MSGTEATMTCLKILIQGAGITGNAIAFWLSKLGHDVTVIDHFPDLRATGLQIDLRGHGIEVLRRTGLEQEFRAKRAPEQGLRVVDSKGRCWAYFPANKTGKGLQSFTTDYEIMRGDLCRLLYNATENRVNYVFGTTVKSFEDKEEAVEVLFTNGTIETFELVIGADGVQSRIRKMMLGSDRKDAFHPIGSSCVGYFTMRRLMLQGDKYEATMFMSLGGRHIMTRRHSPEQMQVYLSCGKTSEKLNAARRGNVKEEKAAFTEFMMGAGWQTAEILKALEVADDFYCERLGLVKLDAWSQGRIVVVGDAAYCPSANTGMGTTSGMVGAYILAGEIGRQFGQGMSADMENKMDVKQGLAIALKAYEDTFRPFMDQVQKGVLEDQGFFPSSTLGIWFCYLFLAVASFLGIDVAQMFLKEGVKNWDLPMYEEML